MKSSDDLSSGSDGGQECHPAVGGRHAQGGSGTHLGGQLLMLPNLDQQVLI